jgi:hypothetical protein
MRLWSFTLLLALGACATSTPSAPDASAETTPSRAEKNRLACKKMCEVAGDAEDNAAAVAHCQAQCDEGNADADPAR